MHKESLNSKNSAKKEAAIQSQYKIAIDVHQNETGRFWTRFNIFVGIQFAGLIGVISNLSILVLNISIFRSVLILCGCFSIFLTLICARGITSADMLLKVIFDIERSSDYLLNIQEIIERYDKRRLDINFMIATSISVMLNIAWWGAFIALELIEYKLILPGVRDALNL